MLSNISWTGYGYTLTFILLIYYAVIITLYFKGDIETWFRRKLSFTASGKLLPQVSKTEVKPESFQQELFPLEENETLPENKGEGATIAIIGSSVDEIRAYIVQIGRGRFVREKVLYGLQRILKKYPALKGSPFQATVTHLIIVELENNCSIALSLEEVNAVWNA
jgi:hypothetical protein